MSRSDGSTADYYVLPEGATQLQDLISHRDMNSQIGEIFRACYRYGIVSHSDKMRDAKKIRFYAQAEVERLEKFSAAHNTGGSIPANATYIVGEAASEQCGQLEEQEAETAAHIISDIPDMRNWKNWKAGDKVVCVSHSNNWSRKINLGSMACIDSVSEDTSHGLHLEIHGFYMTPDDFEFVSRPTSTAK